VGEEVRAEGEWVDDKRFGRQFRASRLSAVPPDSPEGTVRFLASGFIDGIGETYAKRIVERFGTETFDIIEHESQKLEQVAGIGKERRRRIKESWNRQKAVRDIMIFLHAHGLSTARALRIFRTYGQDAVSVLRQNPYRLATELPGVGFRTADEIARQMGRHDDSPERLAAGIAYTMEQAAQQGHCALPREALIERAAETLGAEGESIAPILDSRLAGGDLVVDSVDGEQLVFTAEVVRAEQLVAERIAEMAARSPGYPKLEPERALSWFERKTGFTLGEEQAAAVAGALTHRCFIITGGPGVGKTTILRAVLAILSAKKVEPVLCAPTGRAAQRLAESTERDASTVHRLLEYQPGGGFGKNPSKPLEGDLFVVDEASMLDLSLMAALVAALPGDGHLLLVGDVDQLPSVGPGSVLRDLIASGTVPVARLTQIFRQAASSRIVTAAHAVNEGHLPPLDSDSDSDFFFFDREGPEAIADTLVHLVAERIPSGFALDARDGIQVLTPMNRNALGTKALNAALQARLNPPAELKFEIERFGTTFRTGDKVIQTRNNYDHDVFNGDIGHIREITTEPAHIEVVFDGGREVTYEPGDLDELQLAYAITIHKSQGSEFPAVVIPLAMQHYVLLQRNLLYTGITRGKRLVILVGERAALERAVRNADQSQRWTGLSARLRQASDGSESGNAR